MAVNQVIYGDETLMDLTEDTVTPEKVMKGYTFHDASGEKQVGTKTSEGGDLPFSVIDGMVCITFEEGE